MSHDKWDKSFGLQSRKTVAKISSVRDVFIGMTEQEAYEYIRKSYEGVSDEAFIGTIEIAHTNYSNRNWLGFTLDKVNAEIAFDTNRLFYRGLVTEFDNRKHLISSFYATRVLPEGFDLESDRRITANSYSTNR